MSLTAERLKSRFPSLTDLPKELNVNLAPYEMRYLVNGEIRTWAGAGCEACPPQANG